MAPTFYFLRISTAQDFFCFLSCNPFANGIHHHLPVPKSTLIITFDFFKSCTIGSLLLSKIPAVHDTRRGCSYFIGSQMFKVALPQLKMI